MAIYCSYAGASVYDTRQPQRWWSFFKLNSYHEAAPTSIILTGTAISIKHLTEIKVTESYASFRFGHMKAEYTAAITDLTIDIPKSGIFVLLGPNAGYVKL